MDAYQINLEFVCSCSNLDHYRLTLQLIRRITLEAKLSFGVRATSVDFFLNLSKEERVKRSGRDLRDLFWEVVGKLSELITDDGGYIAQLTLIGLTTAVNSVLFRCFILAKY